MASQRTSKSIAERIDTDYYKHRHPIRAFKRYLSWAALGLSLLLLLVPIVLWDHRIFQAAPVSPSHGMFAEQCWRCHSETWGPMKRLATLDDDRMSVSEQACRACHDIADHSPRELPDDVPHCARCHREHRPEHPLVLVNDSFCTQCHADLRTRQGPPRVAARIKDFEGHPEFARLRESSPDPTNLAFNHQVHLNSQGVYGPGRKLETLDCQSCHEPDSERRYMQPLDFERHCGRCHANTLVFDPTRLSDRPAPHGDDAAAQAAIREAYVDYLQKHPEPAPRSGPLSNRFNPARPKARSSSMPTAANWLDEQVLAARQRLFEGPGGCRYCHQVQSTDDGYRIVSAKPPDRWLPMSRFRHNSHRLLTCTSCHQADGSTQTTDVLLPSIVVCRQCHNQLMTASRAVRSDCVSCHDYHDHSLDRKFDGPLLIEGLQKLKPETTTSPTPITPPSAAPLP